jgi:hypothetical protein
MNRRSFFTKLGMAATTISILPSALTYTRKWVKTEQIWIPNPEWENAPYKLYFAEHPYFENFDDFWKSYLKLSMNHKTYEPNTKCISPPECIDP